MRVLRLAWLNREWRVQGIRVWGNNPALCRMTGVTLHTGLYPQKGGLCLAVFPAAEQTLDLAGSRLISGRGGVSLALPRSWWLDYSRVGVPRPWCKAVCVETNTSWFGLALKQSQSFWRTRDKTGLNAKPNQTAT